jgi:hypothetical protein
VFVACYSIGVRENYIHRTIARCRNIFIFNVNKKIQLDATVRRHLFTAKSLYMFRASLRPSSGVLKTVTATSGIGHNIGAAASFQHGLIRTSVTLVLIRPRWKEAAAPIL